MTYTEKKITNEDDNIIGVRILNIILLICMSDVSFLYMSDGGVFLISSIILYDLLLKEIHIYKEKVKKTVLYEEGTSKY